MRRKHFGRAAALLMAAVLLMQCGAAALGNELHGAETALTENITLARGVRYTTSRQTEHYFTYTPNETVVPMIVYGSKVCNYGDFASMAKLLENKGYNVVGGINGDYYVMATNMPLGILISDGEIRSSDAGLWGVGFRADGTAFIGKPTLTTKITLGTQDYRLGGINKTRADGDFYLFTDQFSYTTGNTTPGRDVILSLPEDGKLTVNCELTLKVEDIVESTGAMALPEGKLVLSLSSASDSWRQGGIDALSIGDEVKLSISCDEQWNDAVYAMGSLYKLVTNGVAEKIDDSTTGPRTAVGIKADGSLVLYTVDGRQSDYSLGLTFAEVSQRLIELGCVEACAMDGGGSTNLQALYVGDGSATPVNRPSGGTERSVSCYIMLAAKEAGSGVATNMAVYPWDNLVLSGSTVEFRTAASDETGRAVALTGPIGWNVSGNGSIDSMGKYVAAGAGTDTVSASSGGLSADTKVTVVSTPDSITIYNEKTDSEQKSITISCGETIDLTAVAGYNHMTLTSTDTAYTWKVDEAVGTIDENGVFTASDTAGSGKLTVSAGEKSVTIDVKVKVESTLIADFETSTGIASASTGTTLTAEQAMDYVARGKGSLAVQYDLSGGEAYVSLPMDTAKAYVDLWVYGDGSGNQLYLEDVNGSRIELATMEFKGWQNITIKKSAEIRSLVIAGNGSGTIWLDHIVAATTPERDRTAPQIGGEVSNGTLTANVIDGVDGVLDVSRIELLCDGKPLHFSYSGSGDVTASLPDTTVAHRLTLRATDVSGNIAAMSWQVGESTADGFADMNQNNWATSYVGYLSTLGVINGYASDGGMVYKPDNEMTRQEFAAVLCRWLGIDTAQYADTELPYADLDEIQDWAMDYVKAATALGLINGSSADGKLYFRPQTSLTRAQIMTVLGRSEPWGYMEKELSFTDVEEIPAWSLRYVKALVSRGAIAGKTDGSLDPNGPVTRAQVAKILTEML